MTGLWLATSSGLTQLIDAEGLNSIEGSHISRWYDAYATADLDGEEPNELATRWLAQLCDGALHLDGYEDVI
jgi:hypothetical protein